MTSANRDPSSFAIYTVENDCQDCYKCVRGCPVKAIKVENGHAQEIADSCIICGRCVEICPVGAKRVRDDVTPVKELLRSGRPVYVSLAPSWVGEFAGVSPSQIVQAIKALGFREVGETALGAQEVSASLARFLRHAGPGLYLSTACPSTVEYVIRYLPHLSNCLTPVASPLLAHCRILRKHMDPEGAMVFFGPCIAKKEEADTHKELLDGALTFQDLKNWFEEEGVDPRSFKDNSPRFFPLDAEEGNHYPIEGGMIETIKASGDFSHVRFLTVSGIYSIKKALDAADPSKLTSPVFIECLTCPGGCINGPGSSKDRDGLSRWVDVKEFAGPLDKAAGRTETVVVAEAYVPEIPATGDITEKQITQALFTVGKRSKEDELNCGGCGYDTCRAFARALVLGRAEDCMCVSYMRKKAHKKANAMLRSMPSGVVIADQDLQIVECNERFATFMGTEIQSLYQVSDGLKGAQLNKIAPAFAHLMSGVLETDQDVHYDHFRVGDKLFEITVFSIEPHFTVGAVVLDVTRREIRRDQIAHRADQVIKKNLATVQEIACRLGEHMADTEILLREIAEGYGSEGDMHEENK
ncbi:[Fe-Fe] hydrogenase large subunit C-terminal domain-containing protein [Dethiosulfovibrio salsuginis]|uniref:Iron only hydrogenase large subunit, C-terminal domain n=1 Tax=Dethiosulfovibrio salsuginis TaxID=561720 RepID=A0A1X7IMN9_9BACT|nr:[Fe-Fe] hydrogenase large subunit C-terminal domain-containing protein [Dethiosulfovibrio salsuginis]SMG15889.1 Iron only hydrogenase large subunit, C-terminal domain [Dethiosulfovibrio salsuginis]